MTVQLPSNVAWFVRQLHDSAFVETHREEGPMDSEVIVFRVEPEPAQATGLARLSRWISR